MNHAGLVNFASVSLAILIIGAVTLLFIVQRELGPASRLSVGGKWLLTAALGSGILAFGIKLAIIATLAGFSKQIIATQMAPQNAVPRAAMRTDQGHLSQAAGPSLQYVWRALPEVAPAPRENPTTSEKVALGKQLFFDPDLSRDGRVSCSSCHDIESGAGVDGRSTSVGIDGKTGNRNAPTVWNAAFQSVLFWDGRAHSLEEQAVGPMLNPLEMGMPSAAAVVQRVAGKPEYREMFARAFGAGQPITIEQIAAAIAAYERTLITPDAPYDRFVRGDANALSPAQLRGMALFQSIGCIMCHSGPNFSNASLLETPPIPFRIFPVISAPGYETSYRLIEDTGLNTPGSRHGAWRIPSLRNVALTAPYFHNGAVSDLKEAVRIMATVQRGKIISALPVVRRIIWSPESGTLTSEEVATVSDRDVDDIVSFLRALSSDSLTSPKRPAT
ncbi:MAG TPA: cytochrome c peroxidase [Gallionella sp.]|nr:cytochrome c peroxidase [Gallionella sp.]